MVKFSNGMWWNRDGIHIDWATEVVKSQAQDGSVRCVATSKHVNHRGDTLNAPTLTIEASSPVPDIVLLTAFHWKAQTTAHQGPDYELFPDDDLDQIKLSHADALKTSVTDTQLSLHTSSLSLHIDTRPNSFNIDLVSHRNAENPTSLLDTSSTTRRR
ncbi:hypothetical protein AN958_09625 [Leucoagaricus sp. SymC.cos]|nr:hypothetical protein AN958_09625 [Leucoagaricus sp. SymC.cos]